MTDDHVMAIEVAKHSGRNLAGKGPVIFPVHMLSTELNQGMIQNLTDRLQGGERGAKDDIHLAAFVEITTYKSG